MNGSTDQERQPLPKGWIETFSNSQQRYYYSHRDTKHTQWHFPTVSEAADPWMAKRRADQNASGSTAASSATSTATSTKRPRTDSANVNSNTNTNTTASIKKKKKRSTDDAFSSLLDMDTTNVAVIVPFRDLHPEQGRAQHLAKFIPHMTAFLKKQFTPTTTSTTSTKSVGGNSMAPHKFHIYIVEQSNDGRKFNRGKLLNIGFDYAVKHGRKHQSSQQSQSSQSQQQHQPHDVFIFHDVDLLPSLSSSELQAAYHRFPTRPYHIARVWDRYSNNPKYFGGIVSFSKSDFVRINGYPNTFWGWGGEDDELQLRCQAIGLKWDYPVIPASASSSPPLITDLEDMNLTEKLQFLRQHKEWKCMVKWEALEEHGTTWKQNGLADLNYKVLKTESIQTSSSSSSSSSSISFATKITVDVQLNANNHWANDKCGLDFLGDWNKK